MAELSRLLRPHSIAVVGGGEYANTIIKNCQKVGFDGEIWPVHPKKAEVAGLKAYPSVDDLPGVPDAAYIAVNRFQTIEVTGALSRMGCAGVVCLASGFLEAEAEDASGADLQRQLLDAAGDMSLIGPNCYGFMNYLDGAALWPDQQGGTRVDSGVAVICQSSNIAMNMSMQRRGVPFAYIAAAGNQAQTGLSTLGAAMLRDERVSVLGLHIEGIDDIQGFEALAETARELGKSVIALKVGKSEQARAATVSHTASLAGSDAGSTALLERLGIARVDSLPVFLETLKLLHVCGPLSSNRIASMSCSGGEASLMADSALKHRLEFPALEPAQEAALRDALGPMVALSNPLDYHTYIWRNADKMGETYSAMMRADLALGVLVLDFPRTDRCDATDWHDATAGALRAKTESGVPIAIVATIHECMPEDEAQKLLANGIAPMVGIDECLSAIDAAIWLGGRRDRQDPVLLPGGERNATLIDEASAKAELAQSGLRIPKSARAATPSEASARAEEIGYPVVLKGEGFAHKTEAGAVKLNLNDGAAVAQAASAMNADSFLVEEMITDMRAEVLIGVVRDPAHGFVLTLGAGGQLTELLADSVSLLVPASRETVDAALSELKVNALIEGYRGASGADRAAILDAIEAIQAYVVANHDRVDEVEVNPLIATPKGAIAADALVRRS